MNKNYETLVDEGLVTAAQGGDREALAKLYDRHCTPLYRFVYRHVNHAQDAEDLTSDVMIRMVNKLNTYSGTATFKTWLYGIARHAIADFWRHHYAVKEELVAEVVGVSTPPVSFDEDAEDEQDDPRVEIAKKVFKRLPENYRTVLEHRFIEQRTVAHTATAMNLTEGNVKVLQYRALKKAALIAKELI